MMTAVIIDDEVYCTDVMQILLSKYCPEVEIIAIFNHSLEALEYLQKSQPDIIFLDIEMPQMNGFQLLNKIIDISSKVIFTTAYDEFALKAIKYNAFDYLLKPIDKEELKAAVKKLVPHHSAEQISYLHYLSQNAVPEKILLPIGNEIIFVAINDIICCEAEGSYCKIYCKGKSKPYLLSKNLREIEELLNNTHFLRCHASWLIHDRYIQKITKGDAMEITLEENISVPVARSKKQEVIDRLLR